MVLPDLRMDLGLMQMDIPTTAVFPISIDPESVVAILILTPAEADTVVLTEVAPTAGAVAFRV